MVESTLRERLNNRGTADGVRFGRGTRDDCDFLGVRWGYYRKRCHLHSISVGLRVKIDRFETKSKRILVNS